MSIPAGPMAARFNRVRLQYIYRTLRQGPTEAGYAYFRARRRRRNIADDEPLLSESDQLALSGAFDIDEQSVDDNARLIQSYRDGGPLESEPCSGSCRSFITCTSAEPTRCCGSPTTSPVSTASGTDSTATTSGPTRCPRWRARSRPHSPPWLEARSPPRPTIPADLPPADAAIATLWTSAFPLLHLRQVEAKFYFVQDNEPQFYPAGAASGMVEQTYRFGFPGIVNTPGLAAVYRAYGNPAVSFVPAVDLDRYNPDPVPHDPAAPVRVFFYGRPTTPRNSFGLGIAALSQLKKRCGDRVQIICAGQNWNPAQFGVAGRIENLGMLGSLDEVADLYRSCDIGLVFMHTKHPSYQPLEFMASGMATISNINPATTWLLRDGENCLLTPPLPTPTADRLGRLVEAPELRRQLADAGLKEIRQYRWDDQIEAVWRAMCLRDPVFAADAVAEPALD